ncbi:MAG: hypothetical protein ACI92G_004019, partial [Candidatus Pelagisphaera sp.]
RYQRRHADGDSGSGSGFYEVTAIRFCIHDFWDDFRLTGAIRLKFISIFVKVRVA